MEIKILDKNWLNDDKLDFEYKKYILLDYIQSVNYCFRKNKIFPAFSNLLEVYNEVKEIRKDLHFSRSLISLNKESESNLFDDEFDEELYDIADLSYDILKEKVEEGYETFKFFEGIIDIKKIGKLPVDKSEGLFIIRSNKKFHVYLYTSTLKNKRVKTKFIESFKSSFKSNIEYIKEKSCKKLNLKSPATFYLDLDIDFPLEETIIPISEKVISSLIKRSI